MRKNQTIVRPQKKKNGKKTSIRRQSPTNILNNRQKVDADTSFALSIVPLIKNLNDDQKTRVYIDILKSIQKVKEPKNSNNQTTSELPNAIQPYASMYPYAYDHHSNPTYPNTPQSTTSPALQPNNSMYYNHPHFNPITPAYYPNTYILNPSNTSDCEIQSSNILKP